VYAQMTSQTPSGVSGSTGAGSLTPGFVRGKKDPTYPHPDLCEAQTGHPHKYGFACPRFP